MERKRNPGSEAAAARPAADNGARLACLVPFCQRTTRAGRWSEWVCGEHWRLTDRRLRRLLGRVHRNIRREGDRQCLAALEARLWERLKRQAAERAVGL
jgi:hypothetical protein